MFDSNEELRTALRESVTDLTVTPETSTGFNCATGVSFPVRPTWTTMSSTCVTSSRGGNLYATAHRGERERSPSRVCAKNSGSSKTC